MEFQQLLDYDQWANERVFAACKKVEDPEVLKELFRLFSHLLTAQLIWVNRVLDAESPSEIWPYLNNSELEKLLQENPNRLQQLVSRRSETFTYKNSSGKVFQNSVEEILLHITIHGQHHRAQMASLLRKAGIKPPATDFIFFLRT